MKTIFECKALYDNYIKRGYSINMERGWPSKEQLDLAMPLLDTVNSSTDLCKEVDYRGYAGTGGIIPLKKLFADLLQVDLDEIYIGGTMSTSIMYDIVSKAYMFGFEGYHPWKNDDKIKFLCPVPGYEKHFKICETFGIEMIPIPMNNDGPEMEYVEELVREKCVKGIWCVPLYSNPTGTIYSSNIIKRLAYMETAAPDFRIFWDNAYVIHHLSDEEFEIANIISECEKAGNPNRVFEFTSTSKVTFPGGGVAVCASSKDNIDWITKNSILQLKSGDKINQYRHYLFFRDKEGLKAHMRKLKDIIRPKFELVDSILHEELDGTNTAKWEKPRGGYFFTIELNNVSATSVCSLCKEAGIFITPAGSIFPYGKDEKDVYIRLAPTYCDLADLEIAIRVFCTSVILVKAKYEMGDKFEDNR